MANFKFRHIGRSKFRPPPSLDFSVMLIVSPVVLSWILIFSMENSEKYFKQCIFPKTKKKKILTIYNASYFSYNFTKFYEVEKIQKTARNLSNATNVYTIKLRKLRLIFDFFVSNRQFDFLTSPHLYCVWLSNKALKNASRKVWNRYVSNNIFTELQLSETYLRYMQCPINHTQILYTNGGWSRG